jgi:hypothetical protein
MSGAWVIAGLALVIAGYCLMPINESTRLVLLDSGGVAGGASSADNGAGIGRRRRAVGALAAAMAVIAAVPMPWALLLAGSAAVIAFVVLGRFESGATRRRKDELTMQQPEILDLIAAAQEAGTPLRVATAEVAALAPEPSAALLAEVGAHLRVGFSEAEAWQRLARDPVWGATARDLARSARTGEAVAETLHLHAERAREQRRDHLNKKARGVAVYSVGPMMACFLPAFILAGVVPIFAGVVSKYLG